MKSFPTQPLASGSLGPSFGPGPVLSDLADVLASACLWPSLQPRWEGVASFGVGRRCPAVRSEQGPSRALPHAGGSKGTPRERPLCIRTSLPSSGPPGPEESESSVTTRLSPGEKLRKDQIGKRKAWSALLPSDRSPCHCQCSAASAALLRKHKSGHVTVLVNVCVWLGSLLFKMTRWPLLWAGLFPLKMRVLKPHLPVLKNVTVFRDRAFKEVIKLKWGC